MGHVHIMTKPTGSVCNLDCDYCFYLEKEKLYPDNKQFKMNQKVLENYIRQNIEAQPNDAEFYNFAWQGGEPTMMGVKFYQQAIELQKQYAQGKPCHNTFQTNGILLNDDWCRFFKQNNFLVGISIDGNESHHDVYRKNRASRGSHQQVLNAIKLLQTHKVNFNALVVLHKGNIEQPLELYQYLRSLGIQHIQFTPLLERIAQEQTKDGLTLVHPDYLGTANVSPWSVRPLQYAHFLNSLFDYWCQNDIGKVFINSFETTLGLAIGEPSNSCVFAPTCGNAIVLEHNGDVYSCDHFVYPEHLLGNIETQTITSMANSAEQQRFGADKRDNLAKECLDCRYISLCNGGCPKHRFEISKNGMSNKNYFCGDYQSYYQHVLPHMRDIYNALVKGETPERLIQHFRQKFAARSSS